MSLTTLTLLDTTVYGTASGNYDGSSEDFFGNSVVAANYYAGQGSIQTMTIRVTGFVGQITAQATLNDDPAAAEWFDVYTYGGDSVPRTDTHPATITGNFSYMRVGISQFSEGTINSITLAY